MLRVNDFFCGAGGMGLGFKYAGFRLGGAWDFDRYAVESYGNNVSPKVKQVDITQMTWDEIPYADVWTFGFPCQDISVAGKQAGMVKGKTRSGLFYEIMRLLEKTEINSYSHLPSIILAENVKAVSKFLPEIEKEYEERGYKMYATLYNSKYWGVPQNRERYFILGVHKSINKQFNFKEQQTDYIPQLSSILEETVDDKYYVAEDKAKAVIEQAMKRVDLTGTHAKGDEEEMPTLPTQGRNGVIDVVGRIDIKGQDDIKRVYNPAGIAPTLTTSGGGNRQPKIIIPVSVMDDGTTYRADSKKDVIWCVRKLTPREYARLQGFPDSFKQLVSDSQMYKQMGNAVTVNISKSVAEQIAEFLTD